MSKRKKKTPIARKVPTAEQARAGLAQWLRSTNPQLHNINVSTEMLKFVEKMAYNGNFRNEVVNLMKKY